MKEMCPNWRGPNYRNDWRCGAFRIICPTNTNMRCEVVQKPRKKAAKTGLKNQAQKAVDNSPEIC